jgi:drug/metabolite transporter (DMT)-like permease
MALLLGLAVTPVRRVLGSRPGPGVAWAIGAGLADAAGVAFFARGSQAGLVAITAAASSAYPVIPLIGGLVLLHERMARWQAVGAVLILAGLVLLGAGS